MSAALALLNGLRLLTALAVMLSAIPYVRGSSIHDFRAAPALEAAVDLNRAVIGEHPHTHSHDDDADAASWGHSQDHSHVVLGLPALPSSLVPPQSKRLRVFEECRAGAHLPFPLERPPCGLLVA
jgi:hypothetical protein